MWSGQRKKEKMAKESRKERIESGMDRERMKQIKKERSVKERTESGMDRDRVQEWRVGKTEQRV